mmetsp:Transcript_79511/g.225380  ORF Transcript_79511/g.225380 Transcript_79511/m.225380 type:complete len:253 (+) Transcript_79511:152-910(+)
MPPRRLRCRAGVLRLALRGGVRGERGQRGGLARAFCKAVGRSSRCHQVRREPPLRGWRRGVGSREVVLDHSPALAARRRRRPVADRRGRRGSDSRQLVGAGQRPGLLLGGALLDREGLQIHPGPCGALRALERRALRRRRVFPLQLGRPRVAGASFHGLLDRLWHPRVEELEVLERQCPLAGDLGNDQAIKQIADIAFPRHPLRGALQLRDRQGPAAVRVHDPERGLDGAEVALHPLLERLEKLRGRRIKLR